METDKTEPRLGRLAGLRVLVAEDRGLIATKILHTLRLADCVPIGPASTLAAAVMLLQSEDAELDAAVLDIDLRGQPVYPLAETLRERGIPILFVTGYCQSAIPGEWRTVHRIEKPFEPATLIASLEEACSGRPARGTPGSSYIASDAIARAVETLRTSRDLVTELHITLDETRSLQKP
ncbi:response regulator [Azospirillum melinis]